MLYQQPQGGPALIAPEWAAQGLNSLYMMLGGIPVDMTGRYKPAPTDFLPVRAAGKAGLAMSFNGTTQHISTPTGAISYGTSFSKFARVTVSSNSDTQTISSTSQTGGAQFRLNAGYLELLQSATAVIISAYHAVPVGDTATFGVTYDGATVRLFVNGAELGSTACTVNFTEGIDCGIGQRYAGNELFNGKIFIHADFKKGLSQQAAKSITANIWQLFFDNEEEDEIVFPAAAGGANSYSYTASGGMVLSGAIATVRGRIKVASGGIQTGGAAGVARGAQRGASGGMSFAGAASQAKGRAVSSSGGLTLGGAASMLRGVARSASGGLLFAGHANVSFSSAFQSLVVTPVGGMLVAGSAAVSRSVRKAAAGGITFAGHALMRTGPLPAFLSGLLPIFRRRRR